MFRKKLNVPVFAIIVTLFIFPQSSCNKDLLSKFLGFGEQVIVEKDDKTIPEIRFIFTHPNTGKLVELISGDPPMQIELKKTDNVKVVVVAIDPEGIKTLTGYPSFIPSCESTGSIGCKVSNIMGLHKVENTAAVGDYASTQLYFVKEFSGGVGKCPEPCITLGITSGLTAEAENFSGLVVNGPAISFYVKH